MGVLRKSLWVTTGGMSGLGVKANSKKARTAKAQEKQAKLTKKLVRQEKKSGR